MGYILSTDVFLELIGPGREPVSDWYHTVDKGNVAICEITLAWVRAETFSDKIPAADRIKYSENLDDFMEEFKDCEGYLPYLDSYDIEGWRSVYQMGKIHEIDAEELFVLGTAIARGFSYVAFQQIYWEQFETAFDIEITQLDHPVD